jgi:hypothetical protein
MMERISVPFFFSYKHPFCVSVVVLFLADEKGKEKRSRKRNEPGTTRDSTFYSLNQHLELSTILQSTSITFLFFLLSFSISLLRKSTTYHSGGGGETACQDSAGVLF